MWEEARTRLRGVFGAASLFLRKLDAPFTSNTDFDATQSHVRFVPIALESGYLSPQRNAAALGESAERPPALRARRKRIERAFGRRGGRRWDSRVIDLDIILWSGGAWASAGLVVPHRQFRRRAFVLQPLNAIVPGWRDPITGRTVRQLVAQTNGQEMRCR